MGNSLKFEMELTQVEYTDFIYVVRFKRLDGDKQLYKDTCTKLLGDLDLWISKELP